LDRVITDKVWREVGKQARTAPVRKAAIAYVTTDDIGLRAGDVLIADASERAIRSGQTDARLLRKLLKTGVIIYSREGLHSKVALFGRHAIVGSANMSGSGLIEASVITDNPVVTSGVAAFIETLSTKRHRLDASQIEKLCAIEVIRTGRPRGAKKPKPVPRLGHSTWIVGVKGLKRDPSEKQQKRIDRRNEQLNEKLGTKEEFSWIQWGKKSRFGRECRAGDTMIMIFVPNGGGRVTVTRRVRVVMKDREPVFNRFYTEQPTRQTDEVSWSRFQKILKAAGFPGEISRGSVRKLDPGMAEAIDRKWTRVRSTVRRSINAPQTGSRRQEAWPAA
jgi:hypothetical protein